MVLVLVLVINNIILIDINNNNNNQPTTQIARHQMPLPFLLLLLLAASFTFTFTAAAGAAPAAVRIATCSCIAANPERWAAAFEAETGTRVDVVALDFAQLYAEILADLQAKRYTAEWCDVAGLPQFYAACAGCSPFLSPLPSHLRLGESLD